MVPDPVDEYLENTAKSNTIVAFKRKNHHLDLNAGTSSSSAATEPHTDPAPTPGTSGIQFRADPPQESFVPPTKRRRLGGRARGRGRGRDGVAECGGKKADGEEQEKAEIKKKVTCGACVC